MVGQRPLKPLIGVRLPVPEPGFTDSIENENENEKLEI
jgi:hypothetical protein